MSDLTLSLPGGDLATPMEGANPSVLPWQATAWRLTYDRGPLSTYALVTEMRGERRDRRWYAQCAGPGAAVFEGDFDTAEAARAAVEEHIAAHVDTNLTEDAGHEHVWVDITRVEFAGHEFICADCGGRKEEPR